VRYPGAVRDPDTGAWISDAEVAEISYTAFASIPDAITARLVVRRVKDARYRDALFLASELRQHDSNTPVRYPGAVRDPDTGAWRWRGLMQPRRQRSLRRS
jgi:hypothetical protein